MVAEKRVRKDQKRQTGKQGTGPGTRQSEAYSQTLLAYAPLGIVLVDSASGKLLEANPKFCALVGRDWEQLQDLDWLSLIHPDDLPRERGNLAMMHADRPVGFQSCQRFIRPDHTIIRAESSLAAVESQDMPRHLCMVRDITDQFEAERRVKVHYALAKAMDDTPTIREGAPKMLQALGEALDWDLAQMWIVEPAAEALRHLNSWHRASQALQHFAQQSEEMNFLPGVGLPGRVWISKEPAWIPDVVTDDNFPRAPWAAEAGLHGGFAFPIQIDGKVMAVVEVFTREVARLDQQMLEKLAHLGLQMGQFMDRKHAEARLAESEELLASILHTLPVAVSCKDIRDDFRLSIWNQRSEEIIGLKSSESLGKTDFDIFSQADAEAMRASDLAACAGSRVLNIPEEVVQTRHGPVILHTQKTIVRDAAGAPHFLVSVSEDITERRQIEDAILRSQNNLNEAQKLAHIGSWEWNPASAEMHWSSEQYRLFGEDGQWFNPSYEAYLDHFSPAERERTDALIQAALTNRENFSVEHELHRPDGTTIMVFEQVSVLCDAEQRPVALFGITQDISDRKQSEAHLQHAMTAEAANRAKTEFLFNMSHEIRTPLNGVLGMLQLLKLTPLDIDQMDLADVAHRSGETLLALLNDLLDFSKIEAGRMELERVDFDPRVLIEDVATLQATGGQDKGLVVCCLVEAEVPDRVCGDPTRLRQILNNLVSNAVKFTEQGEVLVQVSLDACSPESGYLLHFEISDTGIGIPPEQREAIFGMFTQADNSITRKYGGTGLGLAISQRLVASMGGELTVGDRDGGGSIFSFNVPLHQALQAVPAWEPRRELAGRQVLIVDDNPTNRKVLEYYLSHWGIHYSCVADAAEALDQLQRAIDADRPFDLILLDYQMPAIDGISLAQHIQSDPQLARSRMLMLSSGTKPGLPQEAHAAGILGYLPKPIHMHALHDMLTKVMELAPEKFHPLVTRHVLAEEQARQKARVLVVEDNIVNQQVAVGMLRKLGVRADVAADGQQGLQALASRHYDLVLMDMMMPVLDGVAATRQLRNQKAAYNRVPVIAMTANTSERDREICRAAGMDDYLPKPIGLDGMKGILERWLRISPQQDMDLPGETERPNASAVLNPDVLVELRSFLQEGYPQMLHTFYTDAEQRISALDEAANREYRKILVRQAHTIKGSCGNFGSIELKELCFELQQNGETLTADELRQAVAEVKQAYQRLKSALEADLFAFRQAL
ncbi:MAG TPA: response regulator [Candidatus Obscuribacterales bacterium]